MSNTPIFDQLARARGYNRLVSDDPMDAPMFVDPSSWIAVPVPGKIEKPEVVTEKVEMVLTTDPFEAEEKYGSLQKCGEALVKRFEKDHPDAKKVEIWTEDLIVNGMIQIKVTGTVEVTHNPFSEARLRFFKNAQGDPDHISLKKKTLSQLDLDDSVKPPKIDIVSELTETFLSQYPNAYITSMKPEVEEDGSITVVYEAVEPEINLVSQYLAERRVEKYQVAADLFGQNPPPLEWSEFVDAYNYVTGRTTKAPKQTDESVNAASDIDGTPSTATVRALWASPLEATDEEQ